MRVPILNTAQIVGTSNATPTVFLLTHHLSSKSRG